jgi:protein tyrosine/serine phosphatase
MEVGHPPPDPPERTYWVVPGRLLAGSYAGDTPEERQERRLRRFLQAGMRTFINLMEPHETNRRGEPFLDYAQHVALLAAEMGVAARCVRHAIRDFSVPKEHEMVEILDTIDSGLGEGGVYVHCWGGIGRTGTVVACWLLRHGRARADDVFDVLQRLRRMDRERGHVSSPENDVQQRFVLEWAARRG